MPATRKTTEPKRAAEPRATAPLPGLAPRDPRTDVKIAGDWFDRWLAELDEVLLKAYLQIAHFYNVRTYHDASELESVFGHRGGAKKEGSGNKKKLEAVLSRLEKLGLLEVMRHEGKYHYHFPHRDTDGFHRGARARPSIKEALAFQQRMTEELLDLTSQDETQAVRERAFAKHPDLRAEYEKFQRNADKDAPQWRLWMEVSRHLIREFEHRFGSLKEDHGEIFKGSAAQVLRHHLDVVDGVTREVFSHVTKIFRETNEERKWAVAPTEQEFASHPLVRQLSQRYNVGPTEIFANTLEALAHWGITVVETDRHGKFETLVLPSTTGLTKSEDRVLFLRPDEREAGVDTPRNRERVRRARNKYANHLIRCGVETLLDFFRKDRVKDLDLALQTITEKVNEALSLLPTADGASPSDAPGVALEHVIDRFDVLRGRGERKRSAKKS